MRCDSSLCDAHDPSAKNLFQKHDFFAQMFDSLQIFYYICIYHSGQNEQNDQLKDRLPDTQRTGNQ